VVIPNRPKRVWTIAGYAVAAAAVAALVYYAGFRHGGPTGVIAPVTIAVLPFQNLSNDPDQEYFGEGLTEETIAALGQVSPSRIRVIARTSSMAYKTSRKTAAQIGAELSATYLVEGSVRRDPEGVRITAKLIRVQDQVQLWSTSYDRPAAGSLGDQDEIGNAIAGEIGAKLSAVPGKGPARGHTVNADAYDLYLRGRYSLNRRTLDFLRRSSEYFEAAVEKDPSYARAYAGIAEALVFETFITGTNATDQWRKVRLAADKALSLDPELSEAHATAGIADFFMGWDWGAAERSFRRAIALNPNNATAHFYYAHLLSNSLRRPVSFHGTAIRSSADAASGGHYHR
jgi:TolB-like protein